MIDLKQCTCNCANFPRIWLCKHIAAINLQSSLSPSKASKRSEIQKQVPAPNPPPITSASDEESIHTLLGDINTLCQWLNALSNDNDTTLNLKALKLAKSKLEKAINSANRFRALPEKDPNRNQKSWPITIQKMGAGGSKTPEEKPSSANAGESTLTLTEQCIGAIKGKRCHKDPDPYAAGERSGKHAKPDALSTAANEHARAAAPPPLSTAVDFPARAPPSTASAGPAEGYFSHANRSEVVPLAYPHSNGVPGLAFSRFLTASPGNVFAPSFSATAGSTYALSNAEMYFWGQITSRNVHTHTHFSLGHST